MSVPRNKLACPNREIQTHSNEGTAMHELRKDPITREWICIATGRSARPSLFAKTEDTFAPRSTPCPFCPGNEKSNPEDLLSYPPRHAGDVRTWSVRVIPNKYPALSGTDIPRVQKDGIFERMPAVGSHEVVIETPDHGPSLSRLDVAQVELVLRAYRDRYLALREDKRVKYILIFRNHGKVAGASLEHAHSQIIGVPVVPERAWVKIKGVQLYEEYYGRCVYCDLIEQEMRAGERIVAQNASFIAFAPYASRRPFETWIVPLDRGAHFTCIQPSQMGDLAAILKETLLRLDVCLGDPPYNYLLLSTDLSDQFHWHLEILPRLNIAAGFELGSGMFINTVAPEHAAACLREARIF
jgi:UDPglucose--hexose-1-phosphate uridylyltransferase